MRNGKGLSKPTLRSSGKRPRRARARRLTLPSLETLENRLTPAPAAITLNATIRDFTPDHQDFESSASTDLTPGLVESHLNADNKPILKGAGGTSGITSAESFAQWYRDEPEINESASYPLTLNETSPGSGIYRYDNPTFFPIDGQLFDSGQDINEVGHNYHFTMELHTTIVYHAGDTYNFTSDDDLWVFVNGQLKLDLGGMHPPTSGVMDLSGMGLIENHSYSFDLFYAERHTTDAAFSMEISRGTVAGYQITAANPVINGQPFDLLVRPVDQNGNAFRKGLGTVTITTPDGSGPGSFDFTTATPDATGTYTIPGFVRTSGGQQAISLTESDDQPLQSSVLVPVENPPPEELNLSISSSAAQGETVTLVGGFSDASGEEAHRVTVDWGDGKQETFDLDAGVFTFSVSHAFTDGLPPTDPADLTIGVTVRDSGDGEASATAVVEVSNVPPELIGPSEVDQFANQFIEYVRAFPPGSVSDLGGLGEVVVYVSFGDNSLVAQIKPEPDGSFTLRHTYRREDSFVVTVRAVDRQGGAAPAVAYRVHVLLRGVDTGPANAVVVPPGETETVAAEAQTPEGIARVQATYTHFGELLDPAAVVVVAVVPPEVAANPTGARIILAQENINTAYEVRALFVKDRDFAIVNFRYFGDKRPTLTFYNVVTRRNERVRRAAMRYTIDEEGQQVVQVKLDRNSIPRLRDMRGTVFTLSVPIESRPPTDPPRPQTSSTTASAVNAVQSGRSQSSADANSSLTSISADATVAAGLSASASPAGGTRAALGISGGGAAQQTEAQASVGGTADSGPLKDLPKVNDTVTDLPSLNLTPPGSDLSVPSATDTTGEGAKPPPPPDTEEETATPPEGAESTLLSETPQESVSDALFADPPGSGWGAPRHREALLMAALALANSRDGRKKKKKRRAVPGLCS